MHSDDRWHGSEDYPAPSHTHFDQWEGEFEPEQEFPVYWNGFDTWLRRLLFAGAAVLLWTLFFGLIVLAFKGHR